MTTTMNTNQTLINVSSIYGPNYMSKMQSLINNATSEEIKALRDALMDIVDYYNDIQFSEKTPRWEAVVLSANNDSAVNYIDNTFMKYFGSHFWDIFNISWGDRPSEKHGSCCTFIESAKMFWSFHVVHQDIARSCTNIKHEIDKLEVCRVFDSMC